MKKTTLMFLVCAMLTTTFAQKPAVNPIPVNMTKIVNHDTVANEISTSNLPVSLGIGQKSTSSVLVGHSANPYSSLISQSNQVSYEPVTGLIGYVHRGGPTNGSSSQVFNAISENNGTTWDSTNVVYIPQGTNNARYPSGSLWNPSGNTNPNNVYSIVAGPITNGSGWIGTYLAWKKKSGTPKQQLLIHNNAKRLDRNHFTILPSGKFFVAGYAHLDNGTNYTQWIHTLVSGTLDAANDTVINVTTTTITPPFYKPGSDTLGKASYSAAVAFNKTGTVGYYVFVGIRSDIAVPTSNLSYRPIVYKTVNQGLTWNIQPDFDFSTIPSINQWISGTAADTSKKVPYFSTIQDVTVDANDNLHIASYVYGHSSIHPDSLGSIWTYSTIEGIMYDTYMTSGGNWNATLIDIQNTKNHAATDANDLNLDGRMQMGISEDRKKVFYTWADSDPNNTPENVLPDLYVVGRHIDSAVVANKLNITAGTSLVNKATNHCMAPQVKENATDFTIYSTITQFGTQPANNPVNYYFLKDVNYSLTYGSCTPVLITAQPVAIQNSCFPNNISFSVVADPVGNPISYQWQYNSAGTWIDVLNGIPSGAVYSNATTSSMTVAGISLTGNYPFRCQLSNCNNVNTIYSNVSTYTYGIGAAGSISGPSNFCIGSTFTYSIPQIPGATSYNWSLPNGASGSSTSNSIKGSSII